MAGVPLACLTLAGFASVMRATTHIARLPVPLPPQDSPSWQSPLRAFAWGVRSIASTVLTLVLFATYLGIGALAHDMHFSLVWVLASTALVWAGPAQIILISTLGSGATVLLLAPLALLLSAGRTCRQLADVLALVLGLAVFPLAATLHTGVDILISGMSAGTIAYGVHWWREHDPEKWSPVFREDHAQNERMLESDSTQLNQTRARE